MININSIRGKYILTPTVPFDTEVIEYSVSIGGTVIFTGKSRYFGNYEVDCSDWIDTYIVEHPNTHITTVTVTVVFTYDGSSTQTMTLTWTPDPINLTAPSFSGSYAYLSLTNCGFLFARTSGTIRVPLSVTNGILDGKVIDKLDKTTYMDRYGDTYNGSMSNKYELECYIDPCWFQVETGKDLEYEKVILALQNSQITTLLGSDVKISGMNTSSNLFIRGRVKDIEKVETYSSYSVENKIPTLKIIFEVYR